MKVQFLSSKNYEDFEKNYGDCILIQNGHALVVYDCGSVEHADRVEQFMRENAYSSAKVVLSHNDKDHFAGVKQLVERGLVSEVFTLLLFKYQDYILAKIGDGRRTKEGIIDQIKETYSNIASLSGKVPLRDIFTDTYVAEGVSIVGPNKWYTLDAVAKLLDSRESDRVDGETIINAASTLLAVSFDGQNRLLLTGDSSFEAMKDVLKDYNALQLPHHGKLAQADEIFAVMPLGTLYYVSDNTGTTNGGSDDLRRKYHKGLPIKYTKDEDLTCTFEDMTAVQPRGSFCRDFTR